VRMNVRKALRKVRLKAFGREGLIYPKTGAETKQKNIRKAGFPGCLAGKFVFDGR